MRCSAAHLAVLFLLLLLPRLGAPRASAPSYPLLPCMEEVLPCTAYLNTPKHPSPTCCTALHRAAAAEMPCLCRLLVDPMLFVTFNVTREQMLRLPARCSLPVRCRPGAAGSSDPVVEAPPPPAAEPPHHPSSSGRCRSRVARVIGTVLLGELVRTAALF